MLPYDMAEYNITGMTVLGYILELECPLTLFYGN